MPDFEIHADYDGDGRISLSPREYALRSRGVTAIPNLDRDDRRLPTLSAASRPTANVHLDWEPSIKTRADNELIPLVILRRVAAATPPVRVLLRYPASFESALRVYDSSRSWLPPTRAGESQQVIVSTFRGDRSELFVEVSRVGFGPGAASNEIPLTLAVEASGRVTVVDSTSILILPMELSADTAPPVKLFIAEVPEFNTPTLLEAETFARAAGVPLVKVPVALNYGDVWLQDQFQFSFVRKGRTVVPFVIHLPRLASGMTVNTSFESIEVLNPNLEEFVNQYFPSQDLALYRDLYSTEFTFESPAPGGRPRQERVGMHDGYIAFLQLGQILSIKSDLEFILERLSQERTAEEHAPLSLRDLVIRGIPALIERIRHERTHRGQSAASNPHFAAFDRTVRQFELVQRRVVNMDGVLSFRVTIERPGPPVRQAASGAAPYAYGQSASYAPSTTTTPGARREALVTFATADRLWEQVNAALNSLNYGGNIEVSPPAGPAQRRKMVVGWDRDRPMGETLRQILWQSEPARHEAAVTLDTSWLDVGHVDEFMTFVPRRGGNPPFAILTASPGLAIDILTEAFGLYSSGVSQRGRGEWLLNQPYVSPPARSTDPTPPTYQIDGVPYYNLPTSDGTTCEGAHPITRMFRGKRYERQRRLDRTWEYRIPQFIDTMMELLSSNNLYLYELRHTPFAPSDSRSAVYDYFHTTSSHYRARMSVRSVVRIDATGYLEPRQQPDFGYSSNLQTDFVNSNLEVLSQSFGRAPLIDLPVLFDIKAGRTTAFTPDLVNLQQLNEHMMVPRPYGPRMSTPDAIGIVQTAASRQSGGSLPRAFTTRRLQRLIGRERLDVTIHWAHSFLDATASEIADEFHDGFPQNMPLADIARQIMTANPGKFVAGGNLRPGWHRLRIPEEKVDLFELYTHAWLDDLGLRVHWVDSWYYHTRLGGLHCGTNVLRRP